MSGEVLERSAGAIHADAGSLARAAATAGGVHVALVADRSVDEWHRAVEAAGTSPPSRSILVRVDETVRGGAVAASPVSGGRPIGGGVVVGAAEAPLSDPAEYLETVLADLGADLDAGGTVVVDDVGALVPDDADVDSVVSEFVDATRAAGVELHVALTAGGDSAPDHDSATDGSRAIGENETHEDHVYGGSDAVEPPPLATPRPPPYRRSRGGSPLSMTTPNGCSPSG
ncbi:hypothetical protein ACFQFH_06900 [Halobaculum halobium]|uniref:hypothetical protein n=1 Tax=Halobaculum halobium TaxID=3032281 RepID=UPI003607ABD4